MNVIPLDEQNCIPACHTCLHASFLIDYYILMSRLIIHNLRLTHWDLQCHKDRGGLDFFLLVLAYKSWFISRFVKTKIQRYGDGIWKIPIDERYFSRKNLRGYIWQEDISQKELADMSNEYPRRIHGYIKGQRNSISKPLCQLKEPWI